MWAWLINSKFGQAVGAALAILGAALLIYRKGKASQRDAQERENLEEYRNVRQDVDDAVRRSDGDTRPVDERLSKHGALRD